MKDIQGLMIDCLIELNLPKENVIAIATMLQQEKQMVNMLSWIKHHYKDNPIKLRVMLVAVSIKDGLDAEVTDSLINCISQISNSLDLMTRIVMTMKTEAQMKKMTDWLFKHKDNISDNYVLQIAEEISERE